MLILIQVEVVIASQRNQQATANFLLATQI